MKNILFTGLALVLFAFTGSSCKKCYSCYYYGQHGFIYCTNTTNPSQMATLESSCQSSGGVWSLYQQ